MRTLAFACGLVLFAAAPAAWPAGSGGAPDWKMNATIIEACSCPMFCQCYFATKPAAHATDGDEVRGKGGGAR